jgi:restriction endonuclease Mrr
VLIDRSKNMESIVIIAFVAILGYGLYKILFKKETPAEAATEIKNEVVAEVKKIEETVAPVVETAVAEVKKIEEIAAPVVETAVAEVKKIEEIAAPVVETAVAEVEEAVKTEVAEVVAEVKTAAAKVRAPRIKKVVEKVAKPNATKKTKA